MEAHFRHLTSDVYMADACMSVLSQVRYTAENGKRQKPYKALYTVMCARTHRIVAWNLLTSTEHAELQRTWTIVKQRHETENQPPPVSICIDNCCTDRQLLVRNFPQVNIALDVWHMMSRIGKTLSSTRHPQYGIFMKLLSRHIYGEIGMADAEQQQRKKNRTRRVAPQQQLITALDSYFARWHSMPCNGSIIPEKWRGVQLFTSKTWPAWQLQREHIAKGCLNAGDFDISSCSFSTTSPLETLHKHLRGLFHGASSHGASVWFQHFFYQWNLRREAEQNIIVVPGHPLAQPARPWITLDQLGITTVPTPQALASQLQQSTEAVKELVTSSKLSDEDARRGIEELVKQLNAAESYSQTAVAARNIGQSSYNFLLQSATHFITCTDSFSTDELALLRYLRHHPAFAPLFVSLDWDAVTALWWDIVYKARAGTRHSSYTLKTAARLEQQVLAFEVAANVQQHLGKPAAVKPERASVDEIYTRLLSKVTDSSVDWSKQELELLRTLASALNCKWISIAGKWEEKVRQDITANDYHLRTSVAHIPIRPRTINALKHKHAVVKNQQQKATAKAAVEQVALWVQQAAAPVETLLTASSLTATTSSSSSATSSRTRYRRMNHADRQKLVTLCRANMMNSGEVNAVAVAKLCQADCNLKYYHFDAAKVSSSYQYSVKALKL